eukprot:CAMPEP_0119555944 /NCGR_PEP_ID=MMETSP1352-20130426/8017_1 /TAXON_ID=265584 /ORGANISM="Stauroneis constricta, Strain CCMP1120" /LENGTH=228 /DNA_ID=CAMNT_0007602815 /DNA_START=359 /DNA_END=1045 /DNA_ORIENTATION=+
MTAQHQNNSSDGSINHNDVLCGRGGATNNHVGNKRFRNLVADHQPQYLVAKKKDKVIISRTIVQTIQSRGGRFLKRSPDGDVWVPVPVKRATEKTSQALREGLDVRHKTIRPKKMPRRHSDSSEESPRKRTRLVEGAVLSSPNANHHAATPLQSHVPGGVLTPLSLNSNASVNVNVDGNYDGNCPSSVEVPELQDEVPSSTMQPHQPFYMQMTAPRVLPTQCDHVEQV